MKCPNCGHHVKSAQQVWQERRAAMGCCIRCGQPKNDDDMKHLHCLKCRRKQSAENARRQARLRERGDVRVPR